MGCGRTPWCVTASSRCPFLHQNHRISAQDDILPDNVSVQTDDIDITVFDQDWSSTVSASGSGTEVGGHERSSRSPTPGASHEGRPPVLMRFDHSSTASASGSGRAVGGHERSSGSPTPGASQEGSSPVPMVPTCSSTSPSGSGTAVGGHKFSSVSPTPGASHEKGSLPTPACTYTESSTLTESTESIESTCQTDISGTERIPPFVKLYNFEYFVKLSDALLHRFPRNAIHDFVSMLRDKVPPGTKEVELQCALNIRRGVEIGQRLLAHRMHEYFTSAPFSTEEELCRAVMRLCRNMKQLDLRPREATIPVLVPVPPPADEPVDLTESEST